MSKLFIKMMQFKMFFYILCLSIVVCKVNAQDSVRLINKNQKVGISITKADFDNKLSGYIKFMSDWKKFTVEEYVEMVRIYNTIGNTSLINLDYYRMYYHIFMVMYVKDAGEVLEAKIMKGLSMYSKKYNIWIGDRPFGNSNSAYVIDTLAKH